MYASSGFHHILASWKMRTVIAVLSCDNGLIQPQTVTYHTDCYDTIKLTQTTKWTDTYNSATCAGSWTRSITNAPMKNLLFSNLINTDRRQITSVNRLLLGHGFNNLYKYTMRHRTTPNCDLCNIGEVQSLQHLLIHCSFTRTTMTSFIHQNDVPMEAAVVQYLRQGLQEPDRLLDLQRALHQIGIPI
uniref:Isocitrate lyase n=2 Tax=Lygus hesperus TaxID=30085 RepID=A0A0A9W3C5_LYGHE